MRLVASCFVMGAGLLVSACFDGNASVATVQAKALNAVGRPLGALETLERHNAIAPKDNAISKFSLSVRPSSLDGPAAYVLQSKLRKYRVDPDLLGVLTFHHHYSKGESDLAARALGYVNKELAKRIVASVRETLKVEQEKTLVLARLNAQEADEFEEELEFISRMTECQRDIYTGAFGGMGETMREKMQFCLVWDSGILDLIPSPLKAGKVASGVARAGAKTTLSHLTRRELIKTPKFASIAGKYEIRRLAMQESLKQTKDAEKRLVDALLDLQWNIIVEFSNKP